LVRTFGTVPYRDIDPTIPAGIAYVVMFGMMFGDAGHGALLIAIALLLRSGRIRRFAGLRHLWLFVAGAGIAATAFGALYGVLRPTVCCQSCGWRPLTIRCGCLRLLSPWVPCSWLFHTRWEL
jgi:hypothetical protein